MRPAGFIIDVPVTLSIAVRGASREEALRIAQAFANDLSPSQQFVDGYSSMLPANIAITEASLEAPSEESPEVLEDLEKDEMEWRR